MSFVASRDSQNNYDKKEARLAGRDENVYSVMPTMQEIKKTSCFRILALLNGSPGHSVRE
jgi:hypothetical protein